MINPDTDLEKKATNFWMWFSIIAAELLADPIRSDLIGQLDSRVCALGSFDWEIGPYVDGLYYLAISPNLNLSNLRTTQFIVSLSLPCVGWHFLSSKPQKTEWLGIWEMKNEIGKEIIVDSSSWEYILFKFEDEHNFDIDIKINFIDGDRDILNTAVDIALTGYLGEEEFLRSIININIVDEFGEDIKSNVTKLPHIFKHLQSLS